MRFSNRPKTRVQLADQSLPLAVASTDNNLYLPSKDSYLYILVDPVTDEICYAGQSNKTPSGRLQAHCNKQGGSRKLPKGMWIRSLLNLGMAPIMFVVRLCSPKKVDELEKQLIADLWDADCPLVNEMHIRAKRTPDHWDKYRERLSASEWATTRGWSRSIDRLQEE